MSQIHLQSVTTIQCNLKNRKHLKYYFPYLNLVKKTNKQKTKQIKNDNKVKNRFWETTGKKGCRVGEYWKQLLVTHLSVQFSHFNCFLLPCFIGETVTSGSDLFSTIVWTKFQSEIVDFLLKHSSCAWECLKLFPWRHVCNTSTKGGSHSYESSFAILNKLLGAKDKEPKEMWGKGQCKYVFETAQQQCKVCKNIPYRFPTKVGSLLHTFSLSKSYSSLYSRAADTKCKQTLSTGKKEAELVETGFNQGHNLFV